jgi:hypothetical protein
MNMVTQPNYLDTGQSFSSPDLCNNPELKNSSNDSNVTKRMTVSFSGDVARMLEYLAETQGISQVEALRKAIATEAYLLQERMQGSKVLLQKPDKEIREVLFR